MFRASNIVEQRGDITKLDHSIAIVHQCNLFSIHGGGLAGVIHRRFPYSDVYSLNAVRTTLSSSSSIAPLPSDSEDDVPVERYGTIVVHAPGSEEGPTVVSFLSQYEPGSVDNWDEPSMDHPLTRMGAFIQCMKHLESWAHVSGVCEIAFPYCIGCGIGGGDWSMYAYMIDMFASRNPGITIYIVRLPQSVVHSDSDSDISQTSSSDLSSESD